LGVNINGTGAVFRGSGFVPLLPGAALIEKNGPFVGPNGEGFVLASPIFALLPNSPVDSPVAASVRAPWVAKLALSRREEKPAGLLSSVVPNTDGWFTCDVVAPVVVALPGVCAVGCTVGAVDEPFARPKLNVSFGGSEEVAAAGEGLYGGAACLFVIANLNFGFDVSPVSPAEGALALRSELVVVEVEEVGLVNENRLGGAGPLPCEVDETFVGLLSGGFVCPKPKNEGVVVPFVTANEGVVVGGGFCAKGLGMVEVPLAAGVEAEVCAV
jgi:hypothetical protein